MDGHQAPAPVDLPFGLTIYIESSLRQALLQFIYAERVHMGVVSPWQDAIQQSHPEVVPTPVCND